MEGGIIASLRMLFTELNSRIDRKPKMKSLNFSFSVSSRLRKLRKRAYFLSFERLRSWNVRI